MNENYKKLINLIELSNITLVESHEKLFFSPSDEQLKSVRMDTEHGYNKDDPIIKDTEMLNNHKYKFSFSVGNNKYYIAEYVIFISFNIKNKSEIENLLKIDEVRYQTIGMVDKVLFVAFTERSVDRIRIISARLAEQEEIDEYYENYNAR